MKKLQLPVKQNFHSLHSNKHHQRPAINSTMAFLNKFRINSSNNPSNSHNNNNNNFSNIENCNNYEDNLQKQTPDEKRNYFAKTEILLNKNQKTK